MDHRRQGIFATSLFALSFVALVFGGAPSAAASQLDRIEQGDWVWSVRFINEEEAFFYYALGAWQATKDNCPGLIAPEDVSREEAFGNGWIHTKTIRGLTSGSWQEFFGEFGKAYVAAPVNLSAGKSGMASMINARGCDDQKIQRLTQNLARLVSGRRPAYLSSSIKQTLAKELREPTQYKHQYFDETIPPTQEAALMIERDMNKVASFGIETLACYYNEDASSEYYQVQYHYNINTAGNVIIGSAAGIFFVGAMQEAVYKANSYRPIQHPLVRFGSPKFECPSRVDPALPSREIYKPRDPNAVSTAPAPVAPPEPVQEGLYTVFEYGAVPDNYVPPIPDNAKELRFVGIKMAKEKIGSLERIILHPFSRSSLRESESKYPMGSKAYKLAKQDILAAYEADVLILNCEYISESRGSVYFRKFWYADNYPRGLDPARLSARLPDHPLLFIHYPQTTCPPDWDAAKAIDELEEAAKLKPPTWPIDQPLPRSEELTPEGKDRIQREREAQREHARQKEQGRLDEERNQQVKRSEGIFWDPSNTRLQAVQSAPLQYPRRALSSGIEGWVDVTFDVGSDGKTLNANVTGASVSGLFERAAMQYIMQRTYEPYLLNGAATKVLKVTERIEFKIGG